MINLEGFEKAIENYLPTIKKPGFKLPLNQKLFWTAIVLIVYIVLTQVRVFGIPKAPEISAQLRFFEIVLGSKIGSVMTLGIGPIVTAGIVLQLLVGSKIINWDLTKEEYRKKFQLWNKFLAIIFCLIEGFAFSLSGFVPIENTMEAIMLVSLQFALGGILVIYLDEIISKYGIGSGVSLFIVVGVTTQIFNSIFSPLILTSPQTLNPGPYVGNFFSFLYHVTNKNYFFAIEALIPIISTIIVILIVIWVNSLSVELPLAFGALRGFGRTWSLKLLYTSNIPVILAAALITNLTVMASVSSTPLPNNPGIKCSLLGCFDANNNAIDGIIYYISTPRSLLIADIIKGTVTQKEIIKGITYIIFLTIIATLFSVLWVNTAGMDAKSVASQLKGMNLQIPGFRSSDIVIESVLQKYIPNLAVIGGILIGLLAGLADIIGAIGTGTGILLTVMIIDNIYQALKRERVEEAHPLIRKFIGE